MKLNKAVLLLLLIGTGLTSQAQTLQAVSLEEAIEQATTNNKSIRTVDLEKQYQTYIKSSAGYIGKTDLNVMAGQYNSYEWGDNNITISQTIPNPKNFSAQRSLGVEMIKSAESKKKLTINELTYQVKQVYYHLLFLTAKNQLLKQQDSIYNEFLKAAEVRFRTGETKLLEKTTAETQLNEVRNLFNQNTADLQSYQYALQQLTVNRYAVVTLKDSLEEKQLFILFDSLLVSKSPYLGYLQQQIQVMQKERDVIAAQRLPDFTLGYFSQTLIGNPIDASATKFATAGNRFMGFNAGLAISIFNKPVKAKIKAAEINKQIAENQLDYNTEILLTQWKQASEDYRKNKNSLIYYKTSAIPNANLLLYQSKRGYQEGETGYAEYLLAIRSALQIKENYLQTMNQLNQSVIRLEYLAGDQQ